MLLDGGSARALPGTWSATSELLADALAPRFPCFAFGVAGLAPWIPERLGAFQASESRRRAR
ncbi:hypothetical protein Gocc_1689 [Gaiella occulta]|uniref:Uncharacterized protein n=1 Tax=Gaiella occulta TaxID=1002870 RepID=A0A7M2YYH7_9ACTN|nr:hypothetical protein [Gaiella occulta]RDI74800.1 hypothetical protein Gocc_1689 [Gaiella occulta]